MTYNVLVYPEHALLWSVRYALSRYPDPTRTTYGSHIAAGSACVLSIQAALEAIVNRLFEINGQIHHWDELRLTSKIDTLADLRGQPVKWGEWPWQEIARLIRLRNWLAHNKDPLIGLTNSNGEWVLGGLKNRIPKVDPERELLEDSIRAMYDAIREAALRLAEIVGVRDQYEFLRTEKYEPLEKG